MDLKITLDQEAPLSAPFTPETSGTHQILLLKENDTDAAVTIALDAGDPHAGIYKPVAMFRQGVGTVWLSSNGSYIVKLNTTKPETAYVRVMD